MKKHPYVAVMEAVKESLNGEAMRLFKMKVESIKNKEDQMKKVIIDGIEYVPKQMPLLADAKVGDLCKRRDGKWVQIETLCSIGGMPWICYEIGGLRYINNGEQLNTKDRNLDIVEYQPLAPEGSVEWAWQMLNLLGLPIYHPAEGVLTIPVPYSSERFAHCYAKTGWQIHKPVSESPKPESESQSNLLIFGDPQTEQEHTYDITIKDRDWKGQHRTWCGVDVDTAEKVMKLLNAIRRWNKRETDA